MSGGAYLDALDALGDAWRHNVSVYPALAWWLYVRDLARELAPALVGAKVYARGEAPV